MVGWCQYPTLVINKTQKIKIYETYTLNNPCRNRKNVDTFRINSENKLWDANYHPWDGLDYSFVLNVRNIHQWERQGSLNLPLTISTYIKYF